MPLGDAFTGEPRYWDTQGQYGAFGAPAGCSDGGSAVIPNVTLAPVGLGRTSPSRPSGHLHRHPHLC